MFAQNFSSKSLVPLFNILQHRITTDAKRANKSVPHYSIKVYPTRTPKTVQITTVVVWLAFNRRIIFDTHNTKRDPPISPFAI
jgi:hypothetical protein